MRVDDEVLVIRTLAGDGGAFSSLVERYRDAVCAVAYSYLCDFDDVQDAAQDAFVRAYQQLAQLREPAKFGPWLRRVASNVCLGMLRGTERSVVSLDEIPEHAEASIDDASRDSRSAVVREAISCLPEKARITLTLFYMDGYSHSEVADFLEVPINTVRSRLRSARSQLSKEMIDMFSGELGEVKSKVGIASEYVLYNDKLQNRTGDQQIDEFLQMLVSVLRIVTKDRIRSVFLTGDYTTGEVKPGSRLSFTVFMTGDIDAKEDDMRRVWSVIEQLAKYAKLSLGGVGLSTFDAYRKPSVEVPGFGRMPGAKQKEELKNHSLLLWGEDIRPSIVADAEDG